MPAAAGCAVRDRWSSPLMPPHKALDEQDSARQAAPAPRELAGFRALHADSGFEADATGQTSRMSGGLRVCLTLSGGASLGAFQAGACAALLAALECLRDEHDVDIRVDAIGGASAGSIVGLMVAHSLLEGVDGPGALREAWVERVGVDTRRGPRTAPRRRARAIVAQARRTGAARVVPRSNARPGPAPPADVPCCADRATRAHVRHPRVAKGRAGDRRDVR